MTTRERLKFSVNLPPKAKARPRVNGGRARMPEDYRQWKRDFAVECCQLEALGPGPFGIEVVFVVPGGSMRPDLDNALGAVLDALQDAGLIGNDRDCSELHASMRRGPQAIEIELWRL